MKRLIVMILWLGTLSFAETVEENIKKSATQLKKDLQRIEHNVRKNLGDKSVDKNGTEKNSKESEKTESQQAKKNTK